MGNPSNKDSNYIESYYSLPKIPNFGTYFSQRQKDSNAHKKDAPHITSDLYYQILGEDIVIWYRELKASKKRIIHLGSLKNGHEPFYSFKFIISQNDKRITLSSQGQDHLLKTKSIILYNSLESRTITIPKEFKGDILNMVVTRKFLIEYLPGNFLDHSVISSLLRGQDRNVYIIDTVPQFIQYKLLLLRDRLKKDAQKKPTKIKLLKEASDFIDTFFRVYLGGMSKGNQLSDQEFQNYINYFYTENLYEDFPGVKNLASRLHMSLSNFKRRFKTCFNSTPLHYFRGMQMKDACKLLIKDEKVENVAYMYGFNSASNFIRSFKKYQGMTPGQFQHNTPPLPTTNPSTHPPLYRTKIHPDSIISTKNNCY